MASYYNYDPYDSRPRQSHRTESFSRPTRDDGFLKPNAGPRENASGGERRSGGPDSPSTYANRPSNRPSNDSRYDSRYDPRYSYPPRRSPSRARKRRSWPPQPCVEDEVTSLKKEAGSDRLVRQAGKEDVVLRGKIDQEPIIEDVSESANKDAKRHVPKPKDGRSTGGLPTPPSSEDERQRKASRRPSKLDMSFRDLDAFVPEMNKRTSTPYSFTRSAQTPQPQPSDARFLSPDVISPPQADRRALGSKSQPSSPRRDSARYSPSTRSNDYFTAGYSGDESAIDDGGYDTSDSIGSIHSSGSGRQKPSTYPRPTGRKDEPKSSPATSVVDFAAKPKDVPIRRANLDARRNTDTANTLPTMSKFGMENNRRPTPRNAATTLSDMQEASFPSSPLSTMMPRPPSEIPLPRSREASYVGSRGPSPATMPTSRASGPSPRFSADFSREQSSTSSPASKAPSVDGSRPSSPSPRGQPASPHLMKTDLDWTGIFASHTSNRSKNPSRLATSQATMPQMPELPESPRPDLPRSFSAAPPPPRAGTMPYPVHDGPSTPGAYYMPSERSYQFFPESDASRPRAVPEKRSTLAAPFLTEAKTTTRAASPSPYMPAPHGSSNASSRPVRPGMPVRHSTAEIPQVESREPERPGTSDSKRSSYSASSYSNPTLPKDDLQALIRKKIKPCPMPDPVTDHEEWYNIIGIPEFDFCYDCVRDNLDKAGFRKKIERSPKYKRGFRGQCALGGQPWIRLAFLLTLQRGLSDLGLFKALADIDRTTNACPGNQEALGPWYGLRDNDNYFIKDFRVCWADVRKIEELFPSLTRQFVPQPDRQSPSSFRCAMRPDTNRFWPYMSTLHAIHEQYRASTRKQEVDTMPFINLVELKMRTPECTRDTFLTGGLWHFIPALPEFTVCSECFESVVIPETQKGRSLAQHFNHSVQPIPSERSGSSCMLYSRRTRRWFREAMVENDMKYLTRKALGRRQMEVALQEQYKEVLRRMEGLTGDQREELRRLKKEVQGIAEEWQKWE